MSEHQNGRSGPPAAEKVKKAVDEARVRVREGLHAVSGEAGKQYERLSQDVRRGAEKAREATRERLDQTAETMQAGYRRVRTDVGGAVEEVDSFVRENPVRAVAIAAGLGFVVGLIFRSRRDA